MHRRQIQGGGLRYRASIVANLNSLRTAIHGEPSTRDFVTN
jgi:hypothetical protein